MNVKIFGDILGTTLVGEYDNGCLVDPMSVQIVPSPDGKAAVRLLPLNMFSKDIKGAIDPVNVKDHKLLEYHNIDLDTMKGIVDMYTTQKTGIDIVSANAVPNNQPSGLKLV